MKKRKEKIGKLKKIYFKHYANYLNIRNFDGVKELLKDGYDPKEHGYVVIQNIVGEYYIKSGLDIVAILLGMKNDDDEIEIKELLPIKKNNKNSERYRVMKQRQRHGRKKTNNTKTSN